MGVSIDLEVFFNWLIMLKLECLLRSWLSSLKYLQAIIASTFLISFRWLFSLILKLVFAFPTYSVCYIKCTPSNIAACTVYVVKYLIYSFWFVFGWLFFMIACNKVTLNLSVMESICLVFFLCLPFLTLFFLILLLRINSLRFLFCLNDVTNID